MAIATCSATSDVTPLTNAALMIVPSPRIETAAYLSLCPYWAASTNAASPGKVLQQEALDFACILGHADFKASPGWLSRFKARHDIVAKVIFGEAAAVDPLTTSSWLLTNKVLDQYKPSDIYNADEPALFYEMLPSKTLDLKGQKCLRGKHSKRRVTILLRTNMDSTDKRPLLVIGRSKKPRCFKGNRRLPVQYTANLKAWMTRAIFGSWLEAFDTDMRKPLDQGVIRSIKCAYKERLIQRLLLNLQLKRPTVVDMFMALEMMATAWVAMSPAVIANCFNHAGFIATRQASCADPVASQEDSPEGALVYSADGAVPPSLAHTWDELSAVTDGVPDGLSIDEFVRGDEGVVVHEEMTDEVIISSVCQGADAAADHHTPKQERTANPRDVLNAFDVIR
ncbi:tigger transposable element-derived protein 4-like [Dermacentor albipictus]|uniref:tigger transposable element-derived protein 4-like n=1 Tax=Dermacentor albipictus TaxID=60249 RepID=UPI0038FC3A08